MSKEKELVTIFKKKNFKKSEIKIFFDFLSAFSFPERNTLFLILKNYPELLDNFKLILKAKIDYANNPEKNNLDKILSIEEKLISELIRSAKNYD